MCIFGHCCENRNVWWTALLKFMSNILFFYQVHITLTETETIWMLDFPGTCVGEDNEISESVKEKNQRYDEVFRHISIWLHSERWNYLSILTSPELNNFAFRRFNLILDSPDAFLTVLPFSDCSNPLKGGRFRFGQCCLVSDWFRTIPCGYNVFPLFRIGCIRFRTFPSRSDRFRLTSNDFVWFRMYPCAPVLFRADSSDPRISTPSLLLSSHPRCSLGIFVNNPLSLYFVVILSFPM